MGTVRVNSSQVLYDRPVVACTFQSRNDLVDAVDVGDDGDDGDGDDDGDDGDDDGVVVLMHERA
jgi:hypothetical protein